MCRFDIAHALPAAPAAAAGGAADDTASDDAFDWMDALVDFLDEEPAPSSTTTAGSSGASLSSGAPMMAAKQQQQQQEEEQQQQQQPAPLAMPQQPQQLAGLVLPAACYSGGFATFAGAPIGGYGGLVAPVAGPVVVAAAAAAAGLAQGSGASCATATAPACLPAPVPSACSGWQALATANGAGALPLSRARRLANEDKVERTKQKRRESAQRSRERRAAYMKALEEENDGLRLQVAQLQEALRMAHGVTLPVAQLPVAMPSMC